jgi:hypothetical protein
MVFFNSKHNGMASIKISVLSVVWATVVDSLCNQWNFEC